MTLRKHNFAVLLKTQFCGFGRNEVGSPDQSIEKVVVSHWRTINASKAALIVNAVWRENSIMCFWWETSILRF